MDVTVIWLIAAGVSLVPIGLLAWRNLRAVPIGAFIMALIFVVPFGALAVGGAAWNPSSNPRGVAQFYVITVVVLAALAILNLFLMKGPFDRRMRWAAISTGAWGLVVFIMRMAWGQVDQVNRDIANEEYMAPIRAANAEAARLKVELDQFPERRRAAIDSALVVVKQEADKTYEKVERFLVFGDPARDPGKVVVWGVLTMRPDWKWESFAYYAKQLHFRLNEALRLRGYPARVSLGFAPTADVERAGGDARYFGKDGDTFIPQYLPENAVGNVPAVWDLPRRRGSP